MDRGVVILVWRTTIYLILSFCLFNSVFLPSLANIWNKWSMDVRSPLVLLHYLPPSRDSVWKHCLQTLQENWFQHDFYSIRVSDCLWWYTLFRFFVFFWWAGALESENVTVCACFPMMPVSYRIASSTVWCTIPSRRLCWLTKGKSALDPDFKQTSLTCWRRVCR